MEERLQYPIGKFRPEAEITAEHIAKWIGEIAEAPARLREAVAGLMQEQLDTPYREGGWTVRQAVHHVADAHLNSYIRFRWGLTEEEPTIKPYDEARWAELPDARTAPVEVSLQLLEAVTDRWVRLLRAMSPAEFERKVVHPEAGVQRLGMLAGLYAWHGAHHTAHITGLRQRMGW
jgi:uncharacterized damage-inducible protein DinB